MDIIEFVFEETNEAVRFCVITSIQVDEIAYLLVVEEDLIDEEEPEAYIFKAVSLEEEDVIYELVDDDDELDRIYPQFEAILEQTDYEVE